MISGGYFLHVVSSAIFLLVLNWLCSGTMGSCIVSSTNCIVTVAAGLVIWLLPIAAEFRLHSGKVSLAKMPLLMLIAVLDFHVLLHSALIIKHCIVNRGTREFWGEGREVVIEKCQGAADDLVLADSLISDGTARCHARLSLTGFLHKCTGSINTLAPGELFVKIIDPQNGHILAESKHIAAEWSENPDESFAFSIPCAMPHGRRGRLYVVRCELWFSPSGSECAKKVAEALLTTNGFFK